MTDLAVASVMFDCYAAMLFKATSILGLTACELYRKSPTTCCTVLASGRLAWVIQGLGVPAVVVWIHR